MIMITINFDTIANNYDVNSLPKFGSVNGRSMNMNYYGTSISSTIWLPNRK